EDQGDRDGSTHPARAKSDHLAITNHKEIGKSVVFDAERDGAEAIGKTGPQRGLVSPARGGDRRSQRGSVDSGGCDERISHEDSYSRRQAPNASRELPPPLHPGSIGAAKTIACAAANALNIVLKPKRLRQTVALRARSWKRPIFFIASGAPLALRCRLPCREGAG